MARYDINTTTMGALLDDPEVAGPPRRERRAGGEHRREDPDVPARAQHREHDQTEQDELGEAAQRRRAERQVGDDQRPERDESDARRYMNPGSQVASHGNATPITE